MTPHALRPENLLARAIDFKTKRTVYSGPFRGMKYCASSVGSVYYPKILGQYEKELHEVVEKIVAINPNRLIDIGTAEGYYAVGFATRIPSCQIVGFETTIEGQALLREMAKLNNVSDRLTVLGTCELTDLHREMETIDKLVVVCDVEGYEQQLLDPIAVPALKRAAILVEIHEFACPGISELLENRFKQSHLLTTIWQTDRTVADYPFDIWLTRLLPHSYATYRVQEFRPERMRWIWMEPKTC